jgi:hypothetical protein
MHFMFIYDVGPDFIQLRPQFRDEHRRRHLALTPGLTGDSLCELPTSRQIKPNRSEDEHITEICLPLI